MPFKIKRLIIKNFLGISEYAFNPGDKNLISGGNGKGKTSIIDAIQQAIYNSINRPVVVKAGEDEATLFVEFDNGLSIERTISNEGSNKVKVIQDGAAVQKPETFLKSLVGQYAFGFNPISFIQKKDKEQADILLSLLPIKVTEADLLEWFDCVPPVNLNQHGLDVCKELANSRGGYWYEKRAVQNQVVKELENNLNSIISQLPDNYNSEDYENVNLFEKVEAFNKANQHNKFREDAQRIIDNEATDIENIENQYLVYTSNSAKENQVTINDINDNIAALERQIAVLKERLVNVTEQANNEINQLLAQKAENINNRKIRTQKAKEFLEANPVIDTEPLLEEYKHLEQMKGYIPLAKKAIEIKERFEEAIEDAKMYDNFVQIARSKPAELLEKVELPVPGLGINDEGNITINGLPIKNLSTSEQIRVALDIARETCGELKLINIDMFETLDADVQEEFFKQIENDGFQYFITEVTEGELKVERK